MPESVVGAGNPGIDVASIINQVMPIATSMMNIMLVMTLIREIVSLVKTLR